MVNSHETLSQSSATKELDTFIKNFTQVDPGKQTSTPSSSTSSRSSQDDKIPTTPCEKSFATIKSNLSNLEADFVLYKQGTDTTILEMSTQLQSKNEERFDLKKEIECLQTTKAENQKFHNDMYIEQLEMEEHIQQLHNRCKTLERKNTDLLTKITQLDDKCVPKDKPESTTKNELETLQTTQDKGPDVSYEIPTSNRFNNLEDQDEDKETGNSTSSSPKNDTPQQHQPNKKRINTAETIIVSDSNGRYLKPNILCPNSRNSYIRSPTLGKAKDIIDNTHFTNPRTFIVHCGTNDVEQPQSNEEITEQVTKLVQSINEKYPQSHIIISLLLPRKDETNKKVTEINDIIEKMYSQTKKSAWYTTIIYQTLNTFMTQNT